MTVRVLATRYNGMRLVVVDFGGVAFYVTERGDCARAVVEGGRVVDFAAARWEPADDEGMALLLLPREGVPDAAKAARGGRLYYGRLDLGRIVEIPDGEL